MITQGIAARAARGQASSSAANVYGTIFKLVGGLAIETIQRGEEANL